MSLLDAPAYDAARENRRRKRKIWAISIVIAVILIGVPLYFYLPYWRARQSVNHFMTALKNGNYQMAYYLWHANPKRYPMDAFMRDWGPKGEWGVVHSYKIIVVTAPPGPPASGLVALVRINQKPHEAKIWVENHNEDLSFYQF